MTDARARTGSSATNASSARTLARSRARSAAGASPAGASAAGASSAADAMQPAIALLELDSIAVGIEAGDAMVKRAPVDMLRAGTIHPGRYLVLVGGTVGDVEEAFDAGRAVGGPCIVDSVYLPNVHDQVVAALRGQRQESEGEALGIVETWSVAATIVAADAGVKGARVRLLDMRLGDDLGGKGYLLFDGPVAEVEAAVAIGCERVIDPGVPGSPAGGRRAPISRVISQLHAELRDELRADPRFHARIAGPRA